MRDGARVVGEVVVDRVWSWLLKRQSYHSRRAQNTTRDTDSRTGPSTDSRNCLNSYNSYSIVRALESNLAN